MNDMPVSPEQPKKSNTGIIIAVVVVVLLCCCCVIGLGGYFLGDCLTSPNDPTVCPLALNLLSTI
ncbi:MAG: hypothetical protein AB1649_31630 [Chloroflexota bacterium]